MENNNKNNNFEDIKFNYYLNAPSYIKTILSIISDEKVSVKKKALIIEASNYILSSLSKEEIMEYIRLSRLFNEKLESLSNMEVMMVSEYNYKFLEKMLFDSYNRKLYFDILNENIKVCSDYYNEYQDNSVYEMNTDSVDNISIRCM